MNLRTTARWSFGIIGLSLAGVGLYKLADRGGALSRSRVGVALELLFTVGACIGFLALAVIILAEKPTNEQIAARVASGDINPSRMPWIFRAAFYAAYGRLPKWLYRPFLAVGVTMAILVALGILGIVIWMITS